MASGARYRYKGKFISAAKAARIGNLKSAKKFLTTEYTFKGKADVQRRGYQKDIAKQMERAFKRLPHAPKIPLKPHEKRTLKRRKEDDLKARHMAGKIARFAESEDMGFEDAADALFDRDEFFYMEPEQLADYAEEYAEYGEEFFDFDMADLEKEDNRKS